MSTIYLNLRFTNGQGTLMNSSNSIFEFNQYDPEEQSNVSYNPTSGTIHIGQPGYYYAHWTVIGAKRDSADARDIKITLAATGNPDISVETDASVDEIVGSGIINLTEEESSIVLRNDGADIVLGDTSVVASLVLTSIDMTTSTVPTEPSGCDCGTVVNFSNGGVDPTNPFSWPLIFEALQISTVLFQCQSLKDYATPRELEKMLGLEKNTLDFSPIQSKVQSALGIFNDQIDKVCEDLNKLIPQSAGLISMDAYIGHSTMGLVPNILGADIPVLSLFAGPPYPQIISRDGTITSFSAEFDALAAVDVSLFGAIGGVLATLNQIISTAAGAVGTLITALGSIGTMLTGFGLPFPSDYADILNRLIINQVSALTPETNHHMHAVLWHATRDTINPLGGAVEWHMVDDLDLGAIPFLELGLFDNILSLFGDLIAAVGNIGSALVTLLGSKGTRNQVMNTMPLSAKTAADLAHVVSAGDYLMVQFTLKGEDNTTLLAGVLASTLMASVLIK